MCIKSCDEGVGLSAFWATWATVAPLDMIMNIFIFVSVIKVALVTEPAPCIPIK